MEIIKAMNLPLIILLKDESTKSYKSSDNRDDEQTNMKSQKDINETHALNVQYAATTSLSNTKLIVILSGSPIGALLAGIITISVTPN